MEIYLHAICIEILICIEKICSIISPTTQNFIFICKMYTCQQITNGTQKKNTNYISLYTLSTELGPFSKAVNGNGLQ